MSWFTPTSGRVMFERGMASGGYHETIFRIGRWVLAINRDTKSFRGSRYYQIGLRREPRHD